ncbi:hypothetical protein, partial [Aeromonas caviae]|uniref:hypothetical protein n=1 Tax=Aeromonas caviae TaxID=648 RepID=UPI001F37DA6C
QDSEGRMFHGVSALLIEILAGINQQDTPLLLSLRTPEITITRRIVHFSPWVIEVHSGVNQGHNPPVIASW